MGSLQDLFSAAVVAVETRCERSEVATLAEQLLPEEREALGAVAEKRFWDFARGRWCAHQALARLGVAQGPILPGPRRQPLWPAGVVGTITHTSGYAAAAVAGSHRLAAVGVDAEPDAPLPRGVLRRVARPGDLAWVEGAGGGELGVASPDRLLFCAKEAIYKAWYPLAGVWLGFEDAQLSVDAAAQTFRAQILIDGPLTSIEGHFASLDGIIVASVEVAHHQVKT